MLDDALCRPLYHITPAKDWINDPNGMVFFRGQWHVFYQFYGEGVDSMQWGHVVSDDLVRWRRLPAAIGPDTHGQIWSGSAVVDHHDSSGLFGGQPGIVCLYTYWDSTDHRQCQGLAFSRDGLTFEKHPANPVIPQLRNLSGHEDDKDFRDPKVFWHAPTGRWVMAVAGGKLRIFSSPDLIHWRFEHLHEDLVTECPDLFELPVDGDPAKRRWVLSGGGHWYMLGHFDGSMFTPETGRLPFGHGPDFYATQTFSDAPAGRRIGISWLFSWGLRGSLKFKQGKVVDNPFPTGDIAGGSLTVPAELSLRSTPTGVRLIQQPVAELLQLRGPPAIEREHLKLAPETPNPLMNLHGRAWDLLLSLRVESNARVRLRRAGWTLTFDTARSVLQLTRSGDFPTVPSYAGTFEAPVAAAGGRISLRVLVDHLSVEVFTGDGLTSQSLFVLPDAAADALELCVEGGAAVVERLQVYPMIKAIG